MYSNDFFGTTIGLALVVFLIAYAIISIFLVFRLWDACTDIRKVRELLEKKTSDQPQEKEAAPEQAEIDKVIGSRTY